MSYEKKIAVNSCFALLALKKNNIMLIWKKKNYEATILILEQIQKKLNLQNKQFNFKIRADKFYDQLLMSNDKKRLKYVEKINCLTIKLKSQLISGAIVNKRCTKCIWNKNMFAAYVYIRLWIF